MSNQHFSFTHLENSLIVKISFSKHSLALSARLIIEKIKRKDSWLEFVTSRFPEYREVEYAAGFGSEYTSGMDTFRIDTKA